jgi:hypothetical protein
MLVFHTFFCNANIPLLIFIPYEMVRTLARVTKIMPTMSTKTRAVLFILWYFKCHCFILHFRTYPKEEQQVKVDSGLGKGIQTGQAFHLTTLPTAGGR